MLRRQNRHVERYLRRKQELLAIRGAADALYPTDDDNDVNEFASQRSDRNSSTSEVAEDIVGHNDVMDSNSNDVSDAVERAAAELEILNRQEESARSGDTSLYSQRSESSPDQDENPEVEEYVQEVLRQWARKGGAASMRKLDELLIRLSVVFPNLPRSYKTF